MESQSAIVGLIDAQKLAAGTDAPRPLPALRVSDGSTSLATLGSASHDSVQSALAAGGRRWTLAVDGGALSTFEKALPWLVFSLGFGLTLAVGASLREASRRRDAALRVARERSDELAITLTRVERANQDLELAHAEADRLSRVDPLTGLFNRRHFSELLLSEQARSGSGTAAVLLLDLDHFKSVNDRYGHLAGDAVLQARGRADRLDHPRNRLPRPLGRRGVRDPGVRYRQGGSDLARRASAGGAGRRAGGGRRPRDRAHPVRWRGRRRLGDADA